MKKLYVNESFSVLRLVDTSKPSANSELLILDFGDGWMTSSITNEEVEYVKDSVWNLQLLDSWED